MPDFMRRLVVLLRQNLLASIVAVTVLVVGGMASVFVAASQAISQPPTPAEAAFIACKTTKKENQFGLTPTTAYKLPDVGTPHGIIVVPRCSKNVGLPEDDLSYHNKDIDVYLLVSKEQLTRLFGDAVIGESPRVNHPYSVSDEALEGLITSEQRASVETDLTHVGVNYYVTATSLPTRRLTVDHGYEYSIAPFDLLTGVRYAHLPFRQQDIYDAGPSIIIGGK